MGGAHVPPQIHQPHPTHQPPVRHHGPDDTPLNPPPTQTWLARSGRDPRITGAVLVVALALVILLLVAFV
jgi:hypothetical protein